MDGIKEIEIKEAEEGAITIEEIDDDYVGDHLASLLDNWCGIKGTEFLYVKKAGNHLEVGKAEIHRVE